MDYHDKLIRWYLARLRKLAWADEIARQVTPASLVSGDSEAVQALVAGKSRHAASTGAPAKDGLSAVQAGVCILISVVVSAVFALIAGKF